MKVRAHICQLIENIRKKRAFQHSLGFIHIDHENLTFCTCRRNPTTGSVLHSDIRTHGPTTTHVPNSSTNIPPSFSQLKRERVIEANTEQEVLDAMLNQTPFTLGSELRSLHIDGLE